MNPRLLLPVVCCAVALTACGGSSSPAATAKSDGQSGPATAQTPATGAAPSTTSTQGAVGAKGGGTAATTGAAPGSTSGAPAAAPPAVPGGQGTTSTKPGSYTYDSSGTVTVGTPQDASGTSTLTVDPPAAGRQHFSLADDRGKTEQDLVVRADGTYLARLAITNPAFTKEFRPATPALLVPDPASVGRSWSWKATSTDGKTTATVTARVAREETLTVGGARTPTSVITSTLKITGDVTYTGQMETWYDAAHRLPAKEHTKGSGTVSGVQFTTDITSVLRSTSPS